MLGLCAREGLIRSGVVAIDGTKVEANASAWSNRTRRQIARNPTSGASYQCLFRMTVSGNVGDTKTDTVAPPLPKTMRTIRPPTTTTPQ